MNIQEIIRRTTDAVEEKRQQVQLAQKSGTTPDDLLDSLREELKYLQYLYDLTH